MDIPGIALVALLFVAGAQTPLLALLALRRRRTLLVVAGPYALLVPLALSAGRALDEPMRIGLLALAVAPAELAAPGLAAVIRARPDTTGAYVAGTVVVSFALTFAFLGAAGPAAVGPARDAAFAFLAGMSFGGIVPMWRDRALPLLRRVGDLALIVLVGTALLRGAPALGLATVGLAILVLVAGSAAALAAARLGGGDPWSALAGAGTRDFAVAAAIAGALSPAAAALPLAYGAVLVAAATAAVALRRRNLGERR
ncbi:MAG TPA: hypothetical protein VFW12_09110 [Candidatus Limnocylindria bacterium]|nr:hypothetical protein [Candidatus Limnocylindria bacterium]